MALNPRERLDARRMLGAALIAAVLAAAVAVTAYPALSAGLSADDFGFAATGRHLSNPAWLYASDHSLSYFYRPHGLLLWWASMQAFGPDVQAHYVLDFTLHAVNALQLSMVARHCRVPIRIALPLAVLFALHPATFGTSLWLADRFDLLATLGALGTLLCGLRALAGGNGRFAMTAFALLAAGSKETALCALPALAVALLVVRSGRPASWRVATLSMAAAPFAVMLGVRALVLSDAGTAIAAGGLLPMLSEGFIAWAKTAPAMIARAPDGIAYAIAAALLLVACIAAAVVGVRGSGSRRGALALMGLALLLAPGFVQAPVTKLVFVDVAHYANPVNGRFFYLAFAGLAMMVAAIASPPEQREHLFGERAGHRRRAVASIAGALLLAAGVSSAFASHRIATDWATGTRALGEVVEQARRAISTVDPDASCRVRLLGAPQAGDFRGFADVAVKAGLAEDDPRLACVITTETGPYYALVDRARCETPATPDLARTIGTLVLAPHPLGDVCTVFPDPAVAVPAAIFRWDESTRTFVRD